MLHARKNTAPQRNVSLDDNPVSDEVENGVETHRHPRQPVNRFVHRPFSGERT